MRKSFTNRFTRFLRKSADWLEGLGAPGRLGTGRFLAKSHEWRPVSSQGAGPHSFSMDLARGEYNVLFSVALTKGGSLPVSTAFHEKAPLLRAKFSGGLGEHEVHVPISGFTKDGRVFAQVLKYWAPVGVPAVKSVGESVRGSVELSCISSEGERLELPYFPVLSGPRAVRRPAIAERKLVIVYVMESWSGNSSLARDALPDDVRALWDRCFHGFEARPRMVAQSDWTLPATVSCLTGRLPSQHGLYRSARMKSGMDRLPESARTLPAMLRDRQFVCVLGLLGKANFDTGFAEGFDYCYKPEPSLGYSEPMPDSAWAVQQLELYRELDTFLYLHHDILHSPYITYTGPWSRNNPLACDIPRGGLSDDAARAAYIRNLRMSLLRLDSLLSYLRATGQWEQAQIVVAGDHGPDLPPWDRVKHSYPLHQMRLRVPYFVKWPAWRHNCPSGQVSTSGFGNSSLQVARDIASALGISESIAFGDLPQFRENMAGVGIAESIATPVTSSRDDYIVSLMNGAHKYVAFWKIAHDEFRPLHRYRELLFAAKGGPEEFEEERDLSAERPEVVKEFRRLLVSVRPDCPE